MATGNLKRVNALLVVSNNAKELLANGDRKGFIALVREKRIILDKEEEQILRDLPMDLEGFMNGIEDEAEKLMQRDAAAKPEQSEGNESSSGHQESGNSEGEEGSSRTWGEKKSGSWGWGRKN